MHQYLKTKRLNAALTQQQASTLLGYSSSQFLSNVERGLSKPPLKILLKMCEIYSVSEEEMRSVYIESVRDYAQRKAESAWQAQRSGANEQTSHGYAEAAELHAPMN